MNAALGDSKLPDSVADSVFNKWWPDLEREINGILSDNSNDKSKTEARSDRDLIEEILLTLRNLAKNEPQERERPPSGAAIQIKYQGSVYEHIYNVFYEILDSINFSESEARASYTLLSDLNNFIRESKLSPVLKHGILTDIKRMLDLVTSGRPHLVLDDDIPF